MRAILIPLTFMALNASLAAAQTPLPEAPAGSVFVPVIVSLPGGAMRMEAGFLPETGIAETEMAYLCFRREAIDEAMCFIVDRATGRVRSIVVKRVGMRT